jgi:hypothetical protein
VPTTYTIYITPNGDPFPNPFPPGLPILLRLVPGDKIQWVNLMSVPITSFTLPTCVSPQTDPAPIAPGDATAAYTVNNGSAGSFGYSYEFPSPERVVRNGTIDVS